MRSLLLLFLLFSVSSIYAAEGDTTIVQAHQKVDMNNFRSYDRMAYFPNDNKTYHKIIMQYTLGCASGGCSDWDYTTRISFKRGIGAYDSTFVGLDTVSKNPLQIDTIWDVVERTEKINLAKVITPYGNSLSNSWEHEFFYDVTDYQSFFKDSLEFQAFYSGYSAGFSVDIKFIMIEGTPPRDLIQLRNVYEGSWQYKDPVVFENTSMPGKSFDIDPNTSQTIFKINPSGHGFVNSLNCAEFCIKDYYVKTDGQTRFTQSMWRDDCGLNPLFPQGGTWLIDRANWCPGTKSIEYTHDLSPFVSNGKINLDVDIEAYTYTVPQGETPATYIVSAQLLEFSAPNHQLDAEIEDILSPSLADEYARMNPICGEAVVRIRNKGAQNLTSCKITYGVLGGQYKVHEWTGNLGFMESTTVSLDMTGNNDWNTYLNKQEFEVKLESPNGNFTDEVPMNNRLTSSFESVPEFPANLKVLLRTNGRGSDSHWKLVDASDNVLYSGDNFNSNTLYEDTLNLNPGCYSFILSDRSKNGLSFFANNDGNGSIQLRNIGGSFFFKTYQPNFGTELRLNFTVGYGISIDENLSSTEVSLFPNPTNNGRGNLEIHKAGNHSLNYSIIQLNGQLIQANTLEFQDHLDLELNLEKYPSGVYFVKLKIDDELLTKKLIVN